MSERGSLTFMDLPLPVNGGDVPLAGSAQLRPAWFIALLALIDRTVLPRRIAVSNGIAELLLGVADGKVRLLSSGAAEADGTRGSAETARRLSELCTPARPLSYSLGPWTPQGASGHSIADLVNAQGDDDARGEHRRADFHVGAEGFEFNAEGWPVSMPDHASGRALVAAWRAHLWMMTWKSRSRTVLGGEMLIVATPVKGPHRWAIHASPAGVEISAVGQEELGKLISRWRAQSVPR